MVKRKPIIWVSVVILLLVSTWYLADRFSYENEMAYYPVTAPKDSVLTIGLIGDSWIISKTIDTTINYTLISGGINNKTISSGEMGAKTKLIYENLFKDSIESHSSKFIINRRPDYCVVIAGVNDAVGQLGRKYYAHHMTLIIKLLLHYNIRPVVVQLPEFGIVEATDEMNILKKERNKLFAYFTNAGQLDNIHDYRVAFEKAIAENKLKDSIIYIDFDPVCSNFKECRELYNGSSHLSRIGNIKLGKIIADRIIKSASHN